MHGRIGINRLHAFFSYCCHMASQQIFRVARDRNKHKSVAMSGVGDVLSGVCFHGCLPFGCCCFSFFSPARAAQTERSSAVGRDQIELPDALLSMASQAKESDVLL